MFRKGLSDSLLEHSAARGTIVNSVFNLCNTILGSGTLCLPYAMANSGYLLGQALMCVIAVITIVSVKYLLLASDLAGPSCGKTYEALAYKTMGKFGIHLAEFTFIFGGFGTLCGYYIFIASLFCSAFGVPQEKSWLVMTVNVLVVIIPLSLFRNITALRYASLLAVVAIVYLVIFMCYVCATIGFEPVLHTTQPQGFEPVVLSSLTSFTVTLLVTAFCCHNTVLPVYEELRERTPNRMLLAVGVAIALCFLLYAGIGVSGYAVFHGAARDNVLLNFDQRFFSRHSRLEAAYLGGDVGMALCLLFGTPVCIWPFRSCVLSVVLRWKNGKMTPSSQATDLEFRAASIGSELLILAAAIFLPNVRTPLSVVGSVSGSLIIFILPALFYLLQRPAVLCLENSGALLLLAAGCLLGPFMLGMTIYNLFQ